MFLLTAAIVKISHILAGIYFIFPKERPRPNLKECYDETWKVYIGTIRNF